MKKISLCSFIFMLIIAFGFISNTEVSAEIIMIDENVSIKLNSNDKILYQKEIITDTDKLYELSVEKNQLNTPKINTTLVQSQNGVSTLTSNSNKKVNIESKSYLQHYLTIQRESGDIEKYYCLDSFTDIPQNIFDNFDGISTKGGEYDLVTPGSGNYDSTYSVRSYAKIHFMEGVRSTSTEYFEYIKGLWYRGTVFRDDSTVNVNYRRIWFRNAGFDLYTRDYQNITMGPYYAASGSNTVTQNAPSSFYTLLTYPDFFYELVCTCQAEISRGNNTWYLDTTVRKSAYGISY